MSKINRRGRLIMAAVTAGVAVAGTSLTGGAAGAAALADVVRATPARSPR